MGLISYSGGLRYHWRAWRHAHGLWTSHREGVRAWLEAWNPRARHLILIGPSGGYSLPADWLTRFDSITAVDPDPVARAIWRRRGAHTEARVDLLQAEGLREFLVTRPGRAVLFCNVLGQLDWLLTRSDADARAYFKGLEQALAGREWASYHDRVSGALAPKGAASSDRALTNEELLAKFAPDAGSSARSKHSPGGKSSADRSPGGEPIVLADHSTGQLAPELPRRYWVWELRPGHYHLIEGVYFIPTT